jgi:MoxR-like ATPase
MSTINLKSISLNNKASDYVADDSLIKAVEISIALGKPLLVSGEPGTGKTQLAHFVANQLAAQTKNDPYPFLDRPLIFNTKSTSTASDLFYYYDAVSHFRNKNDNVPTEQFVELCAMGLAIALTHGQKGEALKAISRIKEFSNLKESPHSSVVLIDEIDKAPRDFPNDLLNEMENSEFYIRELNQTVSQQKNGPRIVCILTSNSEKNLPNAFLRRCVFYHIPFPDSDKLKKIIRQRLNIDDSKYNTALAKAIDKFEEFRKKAINKKPATSELIDWLNILKEEGVLEKLDRADFTPEQIPTHSYSTITKSHEDTIKISS